MKYIVTVCAFLALTALHASSQLRLPRIYSDGMVLQRDARTEVRGWASPGAGIALTFSDSTYRTSADSAGTWEVTLSPRPAGGPYEMLIASGADSLTLRDILYGDVWVCSGQSNMELRMRRVRPAYESEIARSDNPAIRQFLVPQRYNFNEPESDLPSSSWKSANPSNVLDFSATAYFFARILYERYHIPIGIINASLGGSPVESWMSEEALQEFPASHAEALRFKDASLIREIDSSDNARIRAWYTDLRKNDAGYRNPRVQWMDPKLNISRWGRMNIPGYWFSTTLGRVNGVVWFRKEFGVHPSMAGKGAILVLGRIVDADSVWINGQFVGTTSYQYPPRRYEIPPDVLREANNSITIRVINNAGNGGFVPDKAYRIESGTDTLDLRGEWRFSLGATMEPLASQTFIRWKPLGLYNAMIAPLLGYRIKGVIWYQGESNAKNPFEYRESFPAMIRDWRKHWNEGDFPFLFVQLPNFMETKSAPSESNWALLRESQCRTLSVPNTGMAVTVDIGEWNDIHPLNKWDVGRRLALSAFRVAYGDTDVTSSGPLYSSMRVEGDTIIVEFTGTGSGLRVRGGNEPGQFAIAGTDRKYAWAHATIAGNSVRVWSENVSNPVAVRYAWADNPAGANLYNKEGLPASPFRTDDWVLR